MPCFCCVKMDFGVEEGILDDDFEIVGEDALEYEASSVSRKGQYILPLDNKLPVNSLVICTGIPEPDISWFSINFGVGNPQNPQADIAVHFSVRMPQCYVTRNTKKTKWGIEETTAHRSFPFSVGRPFIIEALVNEKNTLWAVDGVFYCSYKHRYPSPLNTQWIQVVGVKNASLNVLPAVRFPSSAPRPHLIPFREHAHDEPSEANIIWKPNSMAILPDGIKYGEQIVLIGKLRPILYSFTVDLIEEPVDWPKSPVHLHVNVRPYDEAQQDRQLVVLNSWAKNWGQERRQRSARLVPGSVVTLRIVHDHEVWSVFADELIIGEMEMRAKSSKITALRVIGDFFPSDIFKSPAKTRFEPKKRTAAERLKKLIM